MEDNIVGNVIPVQEKTYAQILLNAIDLNSKVCNLRRELKQCRNEMCLKCGQYKEAHNGACNGCRYRKNGEWEMDMHE